MTTCKGNHKLQAIYTDPCPAPGESFVVRWCVKCGAVVVDIDVDGRTSPGAFMAMRLPATEAERQWQLDAHNCDKCDLCEDHHD